MFFHVGVNIFFFWLCLVFFFISEILFLHRKKLRNTDTYLPVMTSSELQYWCSIFFFCSVKLKLYQCVPSSKDGQVALQLTTGRPGAQTCDAETLSEVIKMHVKFNLWTEQNLISYIFGFALLSCHGDTDFKICLIALFRNPHRKKIFYYYQSICPDCTIISFVHSGKCFHFAFKLDCSC